MNDRLTVYIMSSSGSTMRQSSISKRTIAIFFSAIFVFILICGYVVTDYVTLKKTFVNTGNLERKIGDQDEEIRSQRQQIQSFASEINALKNQIVQINDFEKKIRIIANIEKSPEEESLFGIGGSIPEDINTNLRINAKHDNLLREMHNQIGELDVAFTNQEKGLSELIQGLEAKKNMLLCTPAIRPCDGWVTSKFGYRESPFTGRREFHKALDIANRHGSKVHATADGTVISAETEGMYGRTILIDHGYGMVTRYAHLNKFLVNKGASVKRGEPIAEMGNTGRSTGPHLHYEVKLNGLPVNPDKYILN